MRDDSELLRCYAETRSEAAFAELVRRHLDLVYFSSLRRCGGDSHRAEDVAQQVFTELARRAASLGHHTSLVGWLYTTTRNLSAKAVRAEQSRRAREQAAHLMNEADSTSSDAAADWERLRPELDHVLDLLPERDRDAILLRFFGNRPFAEIGRVLKVSDDAARVRTDRALEKLRALLQRRGVTSTAAALALALGASSAMASPPALSATVTTTALAQAAATGGTGAGLTASLAMTLAKVSGGTLAAALALILSTSASTYLFFRAPTAPAISREAAPTAPPPAAISLRAFRDDSPAELRQRLLAAGLDASTTRGLVEAALRHHYREALSARRAAETRQGWWVTSSSWAYAFSNVAGLPRLLDDQRLLREMVMDPLEELFGPDPLDLAVREAKYGFVSEEKRRAFIDFERHHEAASARLPAEAKTGTAAAKTRAERTAAENRLLETLTPDERKEHRLRIALAGASARNRMDLIAGSEQEYRALMAIFAPYQVEGSVRRRDQEPQIYDQITAALGPERAIDYIWTGASEYAPISRAAREGGLPPSTAGQVLQLAAETTQRASAIHYDTTLTSAQKRSAIQALQQAVRPALDALLPPAQQQKVGEEALLWFTALGDGRYKWIATNSGSSNVMSLSMTTTSVESAPPAAPAHRQYAVPRPPAKATP